MAHHRTNASRIFWGLVLIAVGALFLLDRFGWEDVGDLFSTYWPVIFILIGISIFVGNGFRRPGASLFFVLLGALFLLQNLDILEYDVWHYLWPAFIILLGLWLILRPAFRSHGGGIPVIKESDLDLTCIFSGQERKIQSTQFKGGRMTALFGGCDVDFSGAGLEGGKATVEATAIFGGVEIVVPRDWHVVINGTPILGGVSDERRQPVSAAEAKATLYVKGTAIFGGVTVKN
jgi:predicted membrane protein